MKTIVTIVIELVYAPRRLSSRRQIRKQIGPITVPNVTGLIGRARYQNGKTVKREGSHGSKGASFLQ